MSEAAQPLILIVDDVEEDRLYMTAILEAAGYSVCIAENAETGMRLARQRQPVGIVMDVMLPGINGFEATRRLKSDPLTARTPVVIVTAHQLDRREARDARYDALLQKPVRDVDLCNELARLLE
jgi:two-component system cell cycle response regulator DivK